MIPPGMQRVYRRFERWRSRLRGRLPPAGADRAVAGGQPGGSVGSDPAGGVVERGTGRHGAPLAGVCERRQPEYLLAHPRAALSQAKGVVPAVRDPRSSEAGNQVWKRVGLLLDVLGRMDVWLAHQGRTGLTPADRVILQSRFQRLGRDAGSVAALSQDFVGELERAS